MKLPVTAQLIASYGLYKKHILSNSSLLVNYYQQFFLLNKIFMYCLKTLKIFWGISLITENDGKHFLGGLVFFSRRKQNLAKSIVPKKNISIQYCHIMYSSQSQMYNFNFLYYLGIQ